LDLEFFLKERTKFILYFYRTGTKGFLEIIHAIEKEEAPYEPPYSEDGEPAFLAEWMDAQTGLISQGYSALSMLSTSLNLFLEEWTVRIEDPKKRYSRKHKKGWLNAYKIILHDIGFNIESSPADWKVIEQTILARNLAQHSGHITQMEVQHSEADLRKYPHPYFLSEQEEALLKKANLFPSWMAPKVFIDETKLIEVIQQVELLCSWLENQYWNVIRA
jgi:hypothetical protein